MPRLFQSQKVMREIRQKYIRAGQIRAEQLLKAETHSERNKTVSKGIPEKRPKVR